MFLAGLLTARALAADATLHPQVEKELPSLVALYQELHASPELSNQEVRTAARLAGEVRKLGFEVTEGVGGTGVVAVLKNGRGPVLLVRTDMDGLPVDEQTGLPFASRVRAKTAAGVDTGVMHACGHDLHMSAWVGVARAMAARRSSWRGTLVLLAQPAEETGEGARKMLDDGLYARFPKPTHALAWHDSAGMPAGQIGYVPGYALANVDSVDITVKGVGGHGAYPHTTKDPIVLASRIVLTLQTLISRELDPLDAGVVTVGSIHGGTKHNIIPGEVHLQITVRSQSPETRQRLLDGIRRVARGEGIAAGLDEAQLPVVTVDEVQFTPSTYNTPEFTLRAAQVLRARFGEDRVKQVSPVMGGEDFGRYRLADESIQSLMLWVGGVPQAVYDEANGKVESLPSLHSAVWAPDAPTTIAAATEALTAVALDVLKR